MANAVLSHSHSLKSPASPGAGLTIVIVSVVWCALVIRLGAGEMFVTPDGAPPLALLMALTIPVIAFLVAYWFSPSFQAFVLDADLQFMTAIQAWRTGGLGFLALSAYGVLPGGFAWPAGLGDMAIGVSAPWLLVALARRPGLAASRIFVAWQLFGILDLIVAVSLGAFGARLLAVPASATAPMTYLPLVLVPAFLVPVFIILHLAALFQARRFAAEGRR